MVVLGRSLLVSVYPSELKFYLDQKPSFCDITVENNTDNHVAFKVKTTSPKSYYVRPNAGILHPWESCIIRVTLQIPREHLPDQCKDKFLLQSTAVPTDSELEHLSLDTFNKDNGKTVEERKLRVVFVSPGYFDKPNASPSNKIDLQRLKSERDAAVLQTQQLQKELEMLKRRRQRRNNSGFSFKFALLVGFIGVMTGFLLNLSISSPPPQ
uniref:MSP domain-containing protein n=1 Tax=Kalanchoe fedtschenkoi TaxID=63787 RepID=A0A7N0VF38_KALFE